METKLKVFLVLTTVYMQFNGGLVSHFIWIAKTIMRHPLSKKAPQIVVVHLSTLSCAEMFRARLLVRLEASIPLESALNLAQLVKWCSLKDQLNTKIKAKFACIYLPPALRMYLKNSDFGSSTITSDLLLKLFL